MNKFYPYSILIFDSDFYNMIYWMRDRFGFEDQPYYALTNAEDCNWTYLTEYSKYGEAGMRFYFININEYTLFQLTWG
jgi:hypothetical protein